MKNMGLIGWTTGCAEWACGPFDKKARLHNLFLISCRREQAMLAALHYIKDVLKLPYRSRQIT